MQFSSSSIVAGVLFGAAGLYFLRIGKREAHIPLVLYGIALMAYPYFVANDYLLWGIGAALCFMGYRALRSS